MRLILAILIAISLAVAPVVAAHAAIGMKAASQDASASQAADDCHGMKKASANDDCPCCEQQQEAPCHNSGTCLAKCGAQVLGIFLVEPKLPRNHVRDSGIGLCEKLPGHSHGPPTPPPRA